VNVRGALSVAIAFRIYPAFGAPLTNWHYTNSLQRQWAATQYRLRTGTFSCPARNSALLQSIDTRAKAIHVGDSLL